MSSFSPLIALAVVVLAIGGVLNIVGLATDFWMEATYPIINSSATVDIHSGLWNYCTQGICREFIFLDGVWDMYGSALQVCRAMVIVSVACAFLAGSGIILMFAVRLSGRDIPNLIRLPSVAGTFVAAVFLLTGVIYYSVKLFSEYEDRWKATKHKPDMNYAYSFAICIVGAMFMIVSGGLAFVGSRKLD